MSIRNVLAAAALSLLMISCSCGRSETALPSPAGGGAHSSAAAGTVAADEPTGASEDAGALARQATALRQAVDVVQLYLSAVGAAEWQKADALWGHRRAPASGEEGGLRALMPPRAMRIENDPPKVLDDEAAPGYIEVPVRLRIEGQDGVTHRYAGWYRLRHNVVEQHWELTAASVSTQLR